MEIIGKIKMIGETKEVGSNGFKKRELVITTEEQYPQHILVEFVQDKCSLLDNYKENQAVKVAINLRGREWTNPQGEVKYFNSITGWRIENLQTTSSTGENLPPLPSQAFEPATDSHSDEPDDLPF